MVRDLASRLIQRAAYKAPFALAERLEEEWLADLEGRRGRLARLRLALGCFWATAVIAREFSASLATPGASAAHRTLLSGLAHALPQFSHRTVVFALLAGFLVALLGLGLLAADSS